MNATAVCQHWRATLLSSPRSWNRINCATSTMFKTYLKRSKSVPLEVQLRDTSLPLLELLGHHISRLSSLTLVMEDSSGFEQLARHLGNPIPTLNEFGIIAKPGAKELMLSSHIRNDHLLHVKKLRLVEVPSLRAPHAFPNVTELKWITRNFTPFSGSLETLVELPTLERVEIVFQGFSLFAQIIHPHSVTLPNVQRMSLHCSGGGVPNLLEFLKLPSLTSLVVSGIWNTGRPLAILPVTHFSENIPNFAQLPEMEIAMRCQHNRVSFRSPSRATLDYCIELRPRRRRPCDHYRKFWGGLPVDSIRRLVVDMWTEDGDGWVVDLLCDMRSLEHLEFRSRGGHAPRYLREMLMEGYSPPEMKTLTVYFGSGSAARQVQRLEDVADSLDSGINVTWAKDNGIPDDEQ